MTDPMPDRELEEARRIAEAWLAEEIEGVDTADVFKLARAFLALDRAGGRSERPVPLEDIQKLEEYAEHVGGRYPGAANLMRRVAKALYHWPALTKQEPARERQG